MQIQYATIPAMIETINDVNGSIITAPFPYQHRGGNKDIISCFDIFVQYLFKTTGRIQANDVNDVP